MKSLREVLAFLRLTSIRLMFRNYAIQLKLSGQTLRRCWLGYPVVVPIGDQLRRDHARGEAQRCVGAVAALGYQMVAQLRFPGLRLSCGDMVAQAHEIFTLLQRDTVVCVAVARPGDMLQPKSMPELMEDRVLQKADTVADAANAGRSGVPIVGEVAVGE